MNDNQSGHPPYKHIIWDWNGTLFDDAWLCLEVINGLLESRRLSPVTADHYQAVFGFPVIDYYRQVGFNFDHEPFEVVSTAFIQGYEAKRNECQLRTGTFDALKRTTAHGLSQSILSASQQSSLSQIVTQLGLADFFVRVWGIDNHHAHGKVEIGQRWVAEIEVEPAEILLVGDTTHDYEVAQAMGVDCWLMPSGHQSPARLAACGVPVVDSFEALWARFEGVCDIGDKNLSGL